MIGACILIPFLIASAVPGGPAPELTISDLNGHNVAPLRPTGRKATVYIFALSECPIANAYAPEIGRIWATYSKKASINVVLADPSLTLTQARRHAEAYSLKMPVLLDPRLRFGTAVGIHTSPEVVVYDKAMKRVYQGRIDDQYYGLSKRRPTVRTHDLRNALDAVLAGKPVKTPRTEAIGCVLSPP